MRFRRRIAPILFGILGLVLTSAALVDDAHAIVGRPLTPMSYAGVARRTVRRAYWY